MPSAVIIHILEHWYMERTCLIDMVTIPVPHPLIYSYAFASSSFDIIYNVTILCYFFYYSGDQYDICLCERNRDICLKSKISKIYSVLRKNVLLKTANQLLVLVAFWVRVLDWHSKLLCNDYFSYFIFMCFSMLSVLAFVCAEFLWRNVVILAICFKHCQKDGSC